MKRNQEIYCNCCGEKIPVQIGERRKEYFHLEKTWGYFSSKDGVAQTADVCENCMDQWIQNFRIPPETYERTELFEC